MPGEQLALLFIRRSFGLRGLVRQGEGYAKTLHFVRYTASEPPPAIIPCGKFSSELFLNIERNRVLAVP